MVPDFGFVIDGKLAGCAHPGRGYILRETLAELVEQHRITAVVNLAEEPLQSEVLGELRLRSYHMPVMDFSAPSLGETARAVDFVLKEMEAGGCVVVHCAAGYGRTGTLLACCLVARGFPPDAAIAEVRRRRPGSIEVDVQEEFVRHWADYNATRGR